MNVGRTGFLEGMSRAATSVTIVTTRGPAGKDGVTVSSMTSVSADPPTILVCIHHESPLADMIIRNGTFCINLLRDDQVGLSNLFAGFGKAPRGDKFATGDWSSPGELAPRLREGLAVFDCKLVDNHRSGSHFIFIGEVSDTVVSYGKPLIYGSRSYGIPTYHEENL
ncbi:MAG: hypothetical protein CBB68_14110 [Rhodospirillaceae bacterium TMED8]|nr:flavin reductase [Magnetovibrio sp.]OUT48095.1 MAG: hypothetical protein CBB68_14110 [Rhodospirillaceae bacterium TMED8]|tara:strand:+ start:673 stop:1173 length:501 start_codon:yes stop_codon:yes gene_type:complete